MRVLFTTVPTKAPGFHRTALAWALRAAGHEVCLANRPNLVEDITRTGLTAVPVGTPFHPDDYLADSERQLAEAGGEGDYPDPEQLMHMDELRPELLDYTYMQGVFTTMTTLVFRPFCPTEVVDELVSFAREWRPDLVLWDPFVFAGPVVAKAVGAAHARLLYGLDLIGHMREHYLDAVRKRPAELREDPVEEWLGPVLDRYDTAFSEDVVTGQWTIDPVPTSMRLPVDLPYLPMRHIPYNGRAVIPHWLTEPPERPRVCLTLGLPHPEVTGGDRLPVEPVLEAMAGVDAEVIAVSETGRLAGVRAVPDNVRLVDHVPLNELLPSCSAIVHQGDVWTLHTAFAHGVPQVVLPGDLWDIPMRADQVQEAGVGLRPLDVAGVTAGEVREMVVRVLTDPAFARRAAALRDEMVATPAPRDLVPVLEKLTAEHRGGGRPHGDRGRRKGTTCESSS
ncbi:glycosyl transferase [Streptomyces nigrescens]|uniref:Glycosyl transferase n=2 Tax=Streptomyces TaxID=1883 RepID=A0ABM7ZXZ3_STRNI|nr:activator-dependent family glycosyltransferase [Streptomyces nigrescens]MEE4424141.1 activator-dependent family glycosyltransferase [Streptomyces sp. DSM 41528]BDM71236.1 glycosyl transferase [Streptomyces nigrescens]